MFLRCVFKLLTPYWLSILALTFDVTGMLIFSLFVTSSIYLSSVPYFFCCSLVNSSQVSLYAAPLINHFPLMFFTNSEGRTLTTCSLPFIIVVTSIGIKFFFSSESVNPSPFFVLKYPERNPVEVLNPEGSTSSCFTAP